MPMTSKVTIAGPMGEKELNALCKVLPELVLEAELFYIEYERDRDCFFFAASKATQDRHWREGFVLSVADAEAEDWKTIYEPPNF